jgi:hypothetical protein
MKDEFNNTWKATFPESYPIGDELKWVYDKRWFRIHSLPESKRYAENEDEYQIIFKRQNEIIQDLLGENLNVTLLFGLYRNEITNSNYEEVTEFGEFEKVDTLELHQIRPEEYEDEFYYDIYIKETDWKINQRNNILKEIADDSIRMMIISFEKNRIINPYDGGVDLILESEIKRDYYKSKYKDWLSNHPEGL